MNYLKYLYTELKFKYIYIKNYTSSKAHTNASTNLYKQFFKPYDLCFDIGANIGNRSCIFLNIGAKVVAVEPQPLCYEYLEKKYPTIIIEKLGVSNRFGQATLNISKSNVLSSLSQEWLEKVKDKRFKGQIWNEQKTIELVTLDHLISKHGLPEFCKIDVEGHELEVIQGLTIPINGLSFEYALPEATETMAACIRRLLEISPNYKFNYAIGESMILQKKDFLTGEEMLEHLYSPEFQNTSWGDIYAKIF